VAHACGDAYTAGERDSGHQTNESATHMFRFLQQLFRRRGRTFRLGGLDVAERDMLAIGRLFV
jgi:hypothetical protein